MNPTLLLQKLCGWSVLEIHPVKTGQGWISENMGGACLKVPPAPHSKKIESLAKQAEQEGSQPLWEGYEGPAREFSSDQVRSHRKAGNFFCWLVQKRKPHIIIEIGTAFGVSGMYWLSGLEAAGDGLLLTFDPNGVWGRIAGKNLSEISRRFRSFTSTFEEKIDEALSGAQIDIAFVDGIHTGEVVNRQFDMILRSLSPGGLILFDDIDMTGDMKACWQKIAKDPRVLASLTLGSRLGLVELKT